jgi:Sec1-binding region of Mso1
MSSYFSSLTSSTRITNLGSRLNSLRRAITSGEEADDPENEDSSHVSNVLRAYYTEKGRSYPEWLPPDPKAPVPQPRLVATQASLQQGNNSAYGQPVPMQAGVRGGGLGDLWGESGPAQPPASQTSSLRSRGGARTPVAAINNTLRPLQSQTPPPQSVSRRPLPSQRAGSYQSNLSTQSGPGVLERNPSGGSAQERLRARLQGGSSSSVPPPQTQAQPHSHDGGYGQSYHGPGGGGQKRPGGLPSGPRPGGYR